MRGADRRSTPGLRPADADAKRFRNETQGRRGARVRVDLERRAGGDPCLTPLTDALSEWNSPEDAEAYDGL